MRLPYQKGLKLEEEAQRNLAAANEAVEVYDLMVATKNQVEEKLDQIADSDYRDFPDTYGTAWETYNRGDYANFIQQGWKAINLGEEICRVKPVEDVAEAVILDVDTSEMSAMELAFYNALQS